MNTRVPSREYFRTATNVELLKNAPVVVSFGLEIRVVYAEDVCSGTGVNTRTLRAPAVTYPPQTTSSRETKKKKRTTRLRVEHATGVVHWISASELSRIAIKKKKIQKKDYHIHVE